MECAPHVPKARVRAKKKPADKSPPNSSNQENSDGSNSAEDDGEASSHGALSLSRELTTGQPTRSLLPETVRELLPESEYLGESLGLFLLGSKAKKILYHPLCEGGIPSGCGLDEIQIQTLHQQGAFLLPERELCDDLLNDFFLWVAPIVPVVNRTSFMQQYSDPRNPPSLLLMQAVLLAASKVSRNPMFLARSGPGGVASITFYRRAKALYDAGYEINRVSTLQALILMGWYCENPKDISNISYWSRIAIAVAQSIGMHRRVDSLNLSNCEKRLYRRIWWTLFARDRLVSVGMGRPLAINTSDCDVEMISENDFIESDDELSALSLDEQLHARFFVKYARLCEIMGQVISTYYSPASKLDRREASNHLDYDTLLTQWLQNHPCELVWHKNNHRFWASVLHLHYCTAICLLHRAHISNHSTKPPTKGNSTLQQTIHREAAYDAASCMTDIIETLRDFHQLHCAPPFIVYSLYSALLVQVYRIHITKNPTVLPINSRVEICLDALKEISNSWTTANVIYYLFSRILGTDTLGGNAEHITSSSNLKEYIPSVHGFFPDMLGQFEVGSGPMFGETLTDLPFLMSFQPPAGALNYLDSSNFYQAGLTGTEMSQC